MNNIETKIKIQDFFGLYLSFFNARYAQSTNRISTADLNKKFFPVMKGKNNLSETTNGKKSKPIKPHFMTSGKYEFRCI